MRAGHPSTVDPMVPRATPPPAVAGADPIGSDRLDQAEHRLAGVIETIGPAVVALSGGVDSGLLMVAARRVLGPDRVLAATAESASLATGELDLCAGLARRWDVPWTAVATAELTDDRYLRNDGQRCFWCKTALMDQLAPLAAARGATVTLGVNLDDLADHRPGQRAAAERGARFPLVEAGFTKPLIRALAQRWGIEVWDRPAMPCLSSRLPYGTPVSVALLTRVDRAERALRHLGFDDVRVRHYDDTARIEVPRSRLGDAVEAADELVEAVTAAGYRYVTLDLAGLRSGNLNHPERSAPGPVEPDPPPAGRTANRPSGSTWTGAGGSTCPRPSTARRNRWTTVSPPSA
ncbi:MAG: ATP-dependent sacrificial sulfur transferase LarE [Acidimicrobiales bacterium]